MRPALWLLVAATHAAKNFVVLTTPRSGSGWLTTALTGNSCITCGNEYFLARDDKVFAWTSESKKHAVDGLLSAEPGRLTTYAGPVSERFLHVAARMAKRQPQPPVIHGFKWMMDEGTQAAFASWLCPVVKARNASLVFLVRRQLLRKHISRESNWQSRNGSDHRAHAFDAAAAAKIAEGNRVKLQTGERLRKKLLLVQRKNEKLEQWHRKALARGVASRLVAYEDLDRNHSEVAALRRWLLGPERVASGQCHDRGTGKEGYKLHTKPMSSYVENWADVRASLVGTRYEPLLEEGIYAPKAVRMEEGAKT